MKDPNTPVLVGVGIIDQRVDDPTAAATPIELMIEAARAAGRDSGRPELLGRLESILVPVGRWRYADPGRRIGQAVGSPAAQTVSAFPGVSQQTIVSDAASAIARGQTRVALVVGGDAGHRLLRARIEGIELADEIGTGRPDLVLEPTDEILPEHERDSGLGYMPVGYYAIIDSAHRHAAGRSIDEHRDRTAARYHRFSQIAAANPHGWDREVVTIDRIRNGRPLAFPYTKHHVSNWSVDQASALLLCSAAEARRRGVPEDRWVFPQAFAEANHSVAVSARGDLHRCVGAELAGRAALDAARCSAVDLAHVELYSCFPVAVEILGQALGLDDSADGTFTGAMPFAGGPLNNFVLHATAQLAELLRSAAGGRGLVSAVSGLLTKQGFAVWGTAPNPDGYQFVDVTDATAAATDERAVDPAYTGEATIAGYTVMFDDGRAHRGVAVVDLPDGRRSIASTADPDMMATMQAEDVCGRSVRVTGGALRP